MCFLHSVISGYSLNSNEIKINNRKSLFFFKKKTLLPEDGSDPLPSCLFVGILELSMEFKKKMDRK